MRKILIVSVLLVSAAVLNAAEYGGVTASPYLNLGIGARACGMGEAYTAVVRDVDSVFWNPGALVKVTDPQFSFMHNAAFGGTSYEYLGVGFPAEQLGLDIWGSIGIMALLVRVDDVMQTRELPDGSWSQEYADKAYTYGAGGTVIGVSYSWQAAKMFSPGVTIKLINQKIAEEEGWIPAIDIGILAHTMMEGFDVGLVFQNISFMQMNQVKGAPDAPLPLNLKFGLSYSLKRLFTPENAAKDFFTFGMDGGLPIVPANMPFKLHLGFEYGYNIENNILKLRTGYRFNGNKLISDLGALAGLSAGFGYSRNFDGVDAALDYAWIPYGDLGMTHRIGLTVKVGEPTPTPTPVAIKPPKVVKLTAQVKKIAVTWSTESLKESNGYNVYMSYKPGGQYYKLNKEPIKTYYMNVGPLKSGLRVYFVVRTVGKDGKESKNSTEISAVPR